METDVDFGIHFVWINGALVRANTWEEYCRLVSELQERTRRDESRPFVIEGDEENVTYEPTRI